MAHFWSDGLLLVVETDDLAAPVRLRLQQPLPPLLDARWHVVERVVERWRVHEGWWRGSANYAHREYFQLITAEPGGMLLLIYHEWRRREWRLQRLYD